MLLKETKYSYRDIAVVPAEVSSINHRIECNPYDEEGKLPIFTAPMTSVVSEETFQIFEDNKIHAILPRRKETSPETRLKYSISGKWAAYSLNEFKVYFVDEYNPVEKEVINNPNIKIKVLIDIANGHMKTTFDLVRKSKERYGKNIVVMIGNIANPNTYSEVIRSGADYVRLGIGSGEGCITSSNTAVHYPMASLIDETVAIKRSLLNKGYKNLPKIIADGGIRNFSDIIKALALGADYVMIGGLFARLLESSSKKYAVFNDGSRVLMNSQDYETYLNYGYVTLNTGEMQRPVKILAEFYGMASAKGQIDMQGLKTHTSEGIRKEFEVVGSLYGWLENMIDYLRSAMSYTDSSNLQELIEDTTTIVISNNTYQSVNK
jgi:IMP dehydrogenase/GMP reductase